MLAKMKPAALASRRASGFIQQQFSGPEDTPSQRTGQGLIRAELTGGDTCSAAGITVKSPTPVLEMCRKLIAAGHDPGLPLDAYRGATVCLHVRSIGEAAALEIASRGTGFVARRERGAGPRRRVRPHHHRRSIRK
jgi:hypothetical protein